MNVRTLEQGEFAGKRILVRVDFNVPLDGKKITDDARIRAALPSIKFLTEAGGRVILCSHLGRPKGAVVPLLSLAPVAKHLGKLLGKSVAFVDQCTGPVAEAAVEQLADGDILLLENLRFHAAETANDPDFAKQLAGLADCYVNDAFGTAHRAHASTAGVAEYLPAYAGTLIEKEIRILGAALNNPERPFTAILGGAKVSDKIAVIESLLDKVDHLIIGGGMAFTFLRAQGFDVGKSLVEEDRLELAGQLLGRAAEAGVQVHLPTDVEQASDFAPKAEHHAVKVSHMNPDWMGLDIGPLTSRQFSDVIKQSATVLWNGPMGVFEMDAFAKGTREVAQAVAACRGTTIVGGGDSAAAASKFKVTKSITHVSTGGGASLEFLEGKALPGIVALEKSAQS